MEKELKDRLVLALEAKTASIPMGMNVDDAIAKFDSLQIEELHHEIELLLTQERVAMANEDDLHMTGSDEGQLAYDIIVNIIAGLILEYGFPAIKTTIHKLLLLSGFYPDDSEDSLLTQIINKIEHYIAKKN